MNGKTFFVYELYKYDENDVMLYNKMMMIITPYH